MSAESGETPDIVIQPASLPELPDAAEIQNWIETASVWVQQNLLTLDTLIQCAILLVLLGLATLLSKRLAARVGHWTAGFRASGSRLVGLAGNLHLTRFEITLFVMLPFLWVASSITRQMELQSGLISLVGNLATAWALIRLASSVIRSAFWSRTVAVLCWGIAALNILGLLDDTVQVLDSAALQFGETKISVLLIAKAVIVIGIFLWIAAVLSAGLEKVLGRASGLNPSQRVLFNKFSRLALLGLAVVLSLNSLGVDLTAVTVFSGALGIGIGLGLQKVFANLVSGFILLMDKSIKPGDVIAIEETYGWVNKLGARYVSILTRDGKEHLIPNEILISEKVENWSYSNQAIRIKIPVGVSYKSDIAVVKDVLLATATDHKRVLKTPEPRCLIKGFGDSSVDFELRIWIDDPVNGIANITSEIYEAVWYSFKEKGVEIPFPQRDVHIDKDAVETLAKALGR